MNGSDHVTVRHTPLLVALVALAIALGGCSKTPQVPTVLPAAPTTTTSTPVATAAVAVVRIIPDSSRPVAQSGGGSIAYAAYDAEGNERAVRLGSWDATPAVPLGPPTSGIRLTATRGGLYVSDGDGFGYAPWSASRESTMPALAKADEVWASPSGRRLSVARYDVKGKSPFVIIDRSRGAAERAWTPGGAIDMAWLSDTQFLLERDGPADSGYGRIYLATVGSSGHVRLKKTGLVGSCPAASPDGTVWAYNNVYKGFVLYDPVARRDITSWSPSAPLEGGLLEGPPAWADATHVVVPVTQSEGFDSLWVLDVSKALTEYANQR